MKSIYKYQLEVTDTQKILMPKGAVILSVQVQHDTPCIWAIVDLYVEKECRSFEIYGTGNPIYETINHAYIGTFQLMNGNFVGHLFEVK